MDAKSCFIDCNSKEVAIDGDDFHGQAQVADGEEMEVPQVEIQEGSRKLDVVPVMNGSIGGSSCGTCGSQKSKLRLCLEMNIKVAGGGEVPSDEDKHSNADPIKVVVDYPEDVIISVNAKILRLDANGTSVSSDEEAERIRKKCIPDNEMEVLTDQNGNKILDSTFVKVPLSSTLIYPIVEEDEASAVMQNCGLNEMESIEAVGKSIRKSNSGDASLYQTVMDDEHVGFGNISAIFKSRIENPERVLDDKLFSEDSNNVNLGKHPSLKLNSSLMLFKSVKTTPAERLVKALHMLAKYRGVWGIYESEMRIVKHIRILNGILASTDTTTVYTTYREDDYQEVRGLISYFSLEKRYEIRSELLQTFTLLSQKSQMVLTFIAKSEFPVVLASEIETGDCTSEEVYAYASHLLETIRSIQLSETQCEQFGDKFYGSLCSMIIKAEKKQYGSMSKLLFDILLHYHKQLGETDFKWQSLESAAENLTIMKKIKQKLTNVLLKNDSLSPRSEDDNQNEESQEKMKEALLVINDLIVCKKTQDLFTDAKLDVILVTLIHNLESSLCIEFRREALKTIHRILLVIKTEPSGLDKLERLILRLTRESQESGSGDYDRCYRGVLKKIYKIVNCC